MGRFSGTPNNRENRRFDRPNNDMPIGRPGNNSFNLGLLGPAPVEYHAPAMDRGFGQDIPFGGNNMNTGDDLINTLVRRQEQMIAEQNRRESDARVGTMQSGPGDMLRFDRDERPAMGPSFGLDRGLAPMGMDGGFGMESGYGKGMGMGPQGLNNVNRLANNAERGFGLDKGFSYGLDGGDSGKFVDERVRGPNIFSPQPNRDRDMSLGQRTNIPSIFDVGMSNQPQKRGADMEEGLPQPKRRSRFDDWIPNDDRNDRRESRFSRQDGPGRAGPGRDEVYDPSYPTGDEDHGMMRRSLPEVPFNHGIGGRPFERDRNLPSDMGNAGAMMNPNSARLQAEQHLRNIERKFIRTDDRGRRRSQERTDMRRPSTREAQPRGRFVGGAGARTSNRPPRNDGRNIQSTTPRPKWQDNRPPQRYTPVNKSNSASSIGKPKAVPSRAAMPPPKTSVKPPVKPAAKSPAKPPPAKKPETTPEKVPAQKPPAKPETPKESKEIEDVPVELVDNDTIGNYDPKMSVGQNFVVPVSGYFCKLCHKFYNNHATAVVTHCRSQPHYDKLVKYLETKRQRDISIALAAEFSDEKPVNSGKP